MNSRQRDFGEVEFAELFRSGSWKLVTFLWRKLGNPVDAEDAAQEAFLRMWEASGKVHCRSPKSLLFKVAINISIDVIRERKRWKEVDMSKLPEPIDSLSPEHQFAEQEELDRVMAAMRELPERHRRALEMFRDEVPQVDIAKEMGVSVRTVQSYIALALVRLVEVREQDAREQDDREQSSQNI